MSNKLLWQPSDCITIFCMIDIVAVGNKPDDADDGEWHYHIDIALVALVGDAFQ